MQIFTDDQGDDWELAVNVATIKRVKALMANSGETVDLTKLAEAQPGQPPLIVRLTVDEILICDVVYCLVKPQAEARNVSDEDFGARMGGEALANAQQALHQELTDFFQKLGRREMAQMIQTQRTLLEAAVELNRQKISQKESELLKAGS